MALCFADSLALRHWIQNFWVVTALEHRAFDEAVSRNGSSSNPRDLQCNLMRRGNPTPVRHAHARLLWLTRNPTPPHFPSFFPGAAHFTSPAFPKPAPAHDSKRSIISCCLIRHCRPRVRQTARPLRNSMGIVIAVGLGH